MVNVSDLNNGDGISFFDHNNCYNGVNINRVENGKIITNKKIKINGNKISIPCDIEALTLILGQPRAQHYETKPDDKAVLEEMHNDASVTDRVNYMWDSVGIKCYTLDGKTVNTFSI